MKLQSRYLVTLLVLVALLALLQRKQGPKSSPSSKGVEASASAHPEEGKPNSFRKNRPASFPSPRRSQRGENLQLRFERATEIPRKVAKGKVATESPFERLANPNPRLLPVNHHAFSTIKVSYDPKTVEDFVASDAERFNLPLTEHLDADVVVRKTLTRGNESTSLIGKVHDNPLSDVLLVFHDGAVSGSVVFYDTNTHFEFSTLAEGEIAISHLNPETYDAPCGCREDRSAPEQAHQTPQSTTPSPQSPNSTAEESITIIDTVVGYGAQARANSGGNNAIEAKIIESVDRTNLAFENSGIIGIELNLLGTIEDPDYAFPGATAGNMGSSDELGNLDNESDGILDSVTDFRNSLGADHAAFIVAESDGSAGVGYLPGDSMIVALDYMTSTRITFVHELGHNIGCQHAWADTANNTDKDESNYGWRFRGTNADGSTGSKYRTVMSYDWGWARIPYFSNPNVEFNGSPTGAPDGYDASDDPSADPRAVVDGYDGNAGSGYDGTNPGLGARNSDLIQANARFLADNRESPSPSIVVELASSETLSNGTSTALFNAAALNQEVTLTFTIRNAGSLDLDNLAANIVGVDAGSFDKGALDSSPLSTGEETSMMVSFTPTSYVLQQAQLQIVSNDPDDPTFDINLSGAVFTLLDSESFESGLGDWTQTGSGADKIDWSTRSGSTPSSNTGPSGASDGNTYLFTEASGAYGKTAEIETTIDLNGFEGAILLFDYHMYGLDSDGLHVDVFDGDWTEDVWEIYGQQQTDSASPWIRVQLALDDYAGQSGIKLRIRAVTGDNYRSDIAIDNISIYAIPEVFTVTYEAGESGSLNGNSVQTLPYGSNSAEVEAIPNPGFVFMGWSDNSTDNPRTDTSITSDLSVMAIFAPSTPNNYDDWVIQNGLTGEDAPLTAVPLGDGVKNLTKYAFNLDPSVFGANKLLPSSGTSGLPHVSLDREPGGKLSVEFIRGRNLNDLQYTVEFSGDQNGIVTDWAASGTEESVEAIDDEWERVIVADSVNVNDSGCRFVRIKLELVAP